MKSNLPKLTFVITLYTQKCSYAYFTGETVQTRLGKQKIRRGATCNYKNGN